MRLDPRTRGAALAGLLLTALLACTPATEAPNMPDTPAARPAQNSQDTGGDAMLVLTGTLRATESELLDTPTASNWQLILQWLIEEGSEVETGDAIARFDPGGTQTNLHNTRDRYEEKRQDREARIAQDAIRNMELELALRKAEVNYKKAQIDAAVPRNLLAGKEYLDREYRLRQTEQGFKDAQLDLLDHGTASHARVSEIDIELLELRRDMHDLEEELESLTLRASRPGIVLYENHRRTGQPVRVGDRLRATMPVASIPEVDSLEVDAWAGETDAVRLALGMPVRILLDADPSRTFEGLVDRLGSAGERRESWGRGTYRRVAIRVHEVDPGVMKPGMSVRCEVEVDGMAKPALVAQRGDAR